MNRLILCLGLAVLIPVMSPAQWAPAGNHIRTPWAEKVDPAAVHPEYPRPQMVRQGWKNLNGLWEYAISPKDAEAMPSPLGKILVPFPLESSLSGVAGRLTPEDALWYRTRFSIPDNWRRKDVILHFGAVDWACELWVNGAYAGRHQGGYSAFDFDITPFLGKGRQELVLKVLDGTDNDLQPRGKQVLDPSKGGIWYTAVSGIWQTVWAEAVDRRGYIFDYQSEYDAGTETLRITPEILGEGTAVVELLEGGIGYDPGNPSATVISSKEVAGGEAAEFELGREARLWSPDHPYLYGLRISLRRDGEIIDRTECYTAARSITAVRDSESHKRLALNGSVLFHMGPLDQGWWPDGLYTAPTDEALLYDLEQTKEYGFNMIRKHVKVEPSRWYYYCDRLGLMVWQDMPSTALCARGDWPQELGRYDAGNVDQLSREARNNFILEWACIVNQLKKFPCVVVWVPFNEGWGQFETENVVNLTRELDPTRLVNMASGGNWVSGGVGDILDSHHYPNPALRIEDPDMVNVLGEYGGIGLPLEGHTWLEKNNWGYVKFSTSEEATAKYEEFSRQLIPLVKAGCAAAVYTQTTDVERELNGVMTYDRKVEKLDKARVAAANRSVIGVFK